MVDAFKFGLAVGAASCLTTGNSVWKKADCDALLPHTGRAPPLAMSRGSLSMSLSNVIFYRCRVVL